MKYDDINGVEQTLYTDSLGANAYAAVKAELADDTITEERRAALESAFEKMEAERAVKRSEYMSHGRRMLSEVRTIRRDGYIVWIMGLWSGRRNLTAVKGVILLR